MIGYLYNESMIQVPRNIIVVFPQFKLVSVRNGWVDLRCVF